MKETYEELLNRIRKSYLSQENLERVAYEEWERDGRPDGEQMRGANRIRDIHWRHAQWIMETIAELDTSIIWAAHG